MIMLCLIVSFIVFESKVAAFRRPPWTPPPFFPTTTTFPVRRCCNTWDPRWFCPTGQQCYPYPKGTFPDCHG